MTTETFDYIVIGSGSAGAVIAAQIVTRCKGTVLVLEAGPRDASLFFQMPGALSKVIPTKTWAYMTEPEAATGNRSMTVAQGRVLGGSSSVNGMIYIRGQKEDYDGWERDYGCTGWNGDEMLRYFRKAERNESLSGPYHGTEGQLPVSENRYRHPLSEAFVRAGQEYGLPYVNDFNGSDQQGVGFYQTTTFNGARGSTAQTYLKSVADNKNLEIRLDALVERIEIENNRATGVTYSANGARTTAKARREVILSAGAIGSPRIMMTSGFGPAAHLRSFGIDVRADMPVGQNFIDHTHMSVNAVTREPVSLYGQDKGVKAVLNGLQWLVYRSGVLTSNVLEGAAFVDTAGQGRPDTQIHFLPALDTWDDPDGIGKGRTHGITLKVGNVQPTARGEVRLTSANPADLPSIRANYLGNDHDVQGAIRAVKLGLKFLELPSLRSQISEIFSPAPVEAKDDKGLEQFVRLGCKTVYHPVGTCRMGPDPKTSVVDLNLRVHGIDGLRIADSSVFPNISSGNTNAPVIALAEKAADLITGNY